MKSTDQDLIVIQDRSSRRRFIRNGSAFLLTAGAVVAARGARADDCDRGWDGETPKEAGEGTDSDQGTNADAPGCGRGKVPLTLHGPAQPSERIVGVKKIKA